MNFLDLPIELLQLIGEQVDRPGGLLRLSLVNHLSLQVFLPRLDDYDIRHQGSSALPWASRQGFASVVRRLLARPGVDVNTTVDGGCSSIFYAISSYNTSPQGRLALEALMSDKRINPNKLEYEQTPLMYAIRCSHVAAAEYMLSQSYPDVNTTNLAGHTALSFAIAAKNKRMVQLLLEKRCDLRRRDNMENSALDLSIILGKGSIAQMILRHSSSLASNSIEESAVAKAFRLSVELQFDDMIPTLLRYCRNITVRDTAGRSLLHHAAIHGNAVAARLLLIRGLPANCIDNTGSTPLQLAASKGHCSVIRVLLFQEGIDVDAQNKLGATALWLAKRFNHESAARLILERAQMHEITLRPYCRANSLRIVEMHGGKPFSFLVPRCPILERQFILSTPVQLSL